MANCYDDLCTHRVRELANFSPRDECIFFTYHHLLTHKHFYLHKKIFPKYQTTINKTHTKLNPKNQKAHIYIYIHIYKRKLHQKTKNLKRPYTYIHIQKQQRFLKTSQPKTRNKKPLQQKKKTIYTYIHIYKRTTAQKATHQKTP